ncbi:hypothetical protein Adt_21052 [Abeliophyllum distichum]|uniref:Uncharacterized protein n=1 Tax=Abeliophyllum distichum TaxID=126358 RepID=A0ABD1SYA2_9LAMI
MISENSDSHNMSDPLMDIEIIGEASSSSDHNEEVTQGPTVSFSPLMPTSIANCSSSEDALDEEDGVPPAPPPSSPPPQPSFVAAPTESVLPPTTNQEPVPSSSPTNLAQAKRKEIVDEEASREKKMEPSSSEGDGLVRDSRRTLPNNRPDVRGIASINIGSRWDELDSTVFEMLPLVLTMATAMVHMFWSSLWEKVAKEASLEDMMMMGTMNMVWGFVLNFELNSALKELILNKAVLKIKIDATVEDVRWAERRTLEAQVSKTWLTETLTP